MVNKNKEDILNQPSWKILQELASPGMKQKKQQQTKMDEENFHPKFWTEWENVNN